MQSHLILPSVILLATGCAVDSKPSVPGIELSRFSSCGELRAHVAHAALESVVSSMYQPQADIALAEAGDSSESSGPSSHSSTNLQEANVDEPDLIKTDGTHIFALQSNSLSIVKSWPVEETEEVAQVGIEGSPYSLFLHNDRAIVFSKDWTTLWPGDDESSWRGSSTRITVIDVADRGNPKVIREITIEGDMVGARMVGEQMMLTTRNHLPVMERVYEAAWDLYSERDYSAFDWYSDEVAGEIARDAMREDLRPTVEELIAEMPIDSLLLNVEEDGEVRTGTGCTSVYHSEDPSSPELMNMIHIDMGSEGAGGAVDAQSVMAGGATLYASEDHVYVAQTSNNWWWGWGSVDRTTRIHRFDLHENGLSYSASGEVHGWVHNQFSMSEHEGRLRVATTDLDWWWGSSSEDERNGNNVYILDPSQQGTMQVIGAIEGLAPGERIYAMRFQGDKGFMVTFRQVDPLFTLDLSDPTNPQAVGELKIPGYSSFLQTRGKERLIGVGMDGTDDGQITGVSVSLFDVSDFSDPSQVDRVSVDTEWGYSEANHDHHAITMHKNLLTVPFQGYNDDWGYEQGLLVVDISKNAVNERTRITHTDLLIERYCGDDMMDCDEDEFYSSDALIRRTVVMDDYLFSVSDVGIMVSDLANGEDNVASVIFE